MPYFKTFHIYVLCLQKLIWMDEVTGSDAWHKTITF